ncbi:MAG: hypothetical protein K8R69_01910 [Deltaproteobacteria bacterium]|nr:hypothetical protein [Deltaproteobacteria bacterium]
MRRSILVFSILTLFFSVPLHAQVSNPKSTMELNPSSSDTEIEVESALQNGMTRLIEGIKESGDLLKKNQWDDSSVKLKEVRDFLRGAMNKMGGIPADDERELSFGRILNELDSANYAIDQRRKKEAMQNLSQAYRMTVALSKSPVLKLVASKVSLYLANQQIESKNYVTAGAFLDRAIDSLTQIQQDPNLNEKEINALKNSIVIAHQQVINGKSYNGSYMSKMYQRATAATSNALYQYYDMWTRTPEPWEAWE